MDHKRKNIFVSGPITPEKIAASIQKHSSKTSIGGHSIFLGQVSAHQKEEGIVQAIDYTADEALALEKAEKIREEIFARHPLTCMHIYHSLGMVRAGEIRLFVFTSSEDRKNAIDACGELYQLNIKITPVATAFKPWLNRGNVGFSRKGS